MTRPHAAWSGPHMCGPPAGARAGWTHIVSATTRRTGDRRNERETIPSAELHHGELEADWARAKDGGTPEPIDPLP